MLTVYCFLSPRSSHLTPIPVKPTPFLQISFLDSHLIVIVIGPLSWTNTICVVSGLELSSEAWWTHCLVQCKQQLSLHKNLSITNSSARSWSKSSWLITEPWTTGHLVKPQATETAVRYVCNGCVIHGQHHLLFLSLPPTSSCFQLSEIQCSLNFKRDNVNLGMCSKLPLFLTNLSSHESLYSLPFTPIWSFYD